MKKMKKKIFSYHVRKKKKMSQNHRLLHDVSFKLPISAHGLSANSETLASLREALQQDVKQMDEWKAQIDALEDWNWRKAVLRSRYQERLADLDKRRRAVKHLVR